MIKRRVILTVMGTATVKTGGRAYTRITSLRLWDVQGTHPSVPIVRPQIHCERSTSPCAAGCRHCEERKRRGNLPDVLVRRCTPRQADGDVCHTQIQSQVVNYFVSQGLVPSIESGGCDPAGQHMSSIYNASQTRFYRKQGQSQRYNGSC